MGRDPSTPDAYIRLPSTIRSALAAGFVIVFALWLATGYELFRSQRDAERRVGEIQESFARGTQTLSIVRTNVLLGSIYLRDALIDTGSANRAYYRARLRRIRDEIEPRLRAYVTEVELPVEREEWTQLQQTLDRYWASLDLVLGPDAPSTPGQGTGMLRREVVPARQDVLQIVDRISALQRVSQQRRQTEASVLNGQVRTRFVVIGSATLVMGVLVALFAFWRVGELESQIHRQRLAETASRQELQRLSARLVDAQEQERRSLARELHDEVGQALTAIKMDIGVALRSVDGASRARGALEEARGIAEGTLQSVRDLSQLLHPSMLDDFGLPETLTAYLRSFSKRTGIRAHLVHDGLGQRLPAGIEVCVYRIVQEAVTNVARHSGAGRCTVTVARDGGAVQLIVEDDGCGIPADAVRDGLHRGIGVIGMRERAQSLAGRFNVEGTPAGTRVMVHLPVPESAPAPLDQPLAG